MKFAQFASVGCVSLLFALSANASSDDVTSEKSPRHPLSSQVHSSHENVNQERQDKKLSPSAKDEGGLTNGGEPKFVCNSGSQYIDGVGYNGGFYQPRVHFRGVGDGTWAYLNYKNGVDTDYGKAMLSVALTAYATGTNVYIQCDSNSNSNNVIGIWLRRYQQ